VLHVELAERLVRAAELVQERLAPARQLIRKPERCALSGATEEGLAHAWLFLIKPKMGDFLIGERTGAGALGWLVKSEFGNFGV
jgi:hypothetical protein